MIDYTALYEKLYEHGYHSDPYQHHALKAMAPWLVDRLRWATCLELGAANGAAVEYLNAKGKKAVGLEISPVAIEVAQAYGRDVRLGSAVALPFDADSFDLVWSSDLLEHLAPADVDTAIAEQVRVTRKYIAHRIACRPARIEKWNNLAGYNLHLTVEPIQTWIVRFEAHGLRLIHQGEKDREFVVFRKPCSACRRKKSQATIV